MLCMLADVSVGSFCKITYKVLDFLIEDDMIFNLSLALQRSCICLDFPPWPLLYTKLGRHASLVYMVEWIEVLS